MAECLVSLAGVIDPIVTIMHFDRKDDDMIDKFNHKVSTIVYFLLMVTVLLYQILLEKLIRCWTPAQFPDHWTEYTNQLCWVKNTYYVPEDVHDIPGVHDERVHIIYYQWIPYVLFGLAVLSYFPGLLWYQGSKVLGMDLNYMVRNLREIEIAVNPDTRDRMGKSVAKHIVRAIAINRNVKRGAINSITTRLSQYYLWLGPTSGHFLFLLWVTTKILYIAGAILQFYLLTIYIGEGFFMLGPNAVSYMFMDGEKLATFPKVTLCDFSIRTIAETHLHTVQCALPINTVNEKVFIFVWFWILLLGIANVIGLIRGILLFVDTQRHTKTKTYLKMADSYDKADAKILNKFCTDFLRSDGLITLNILQKNCNPVVVSEIVKHLWDMYNYDPKFPLPTTRCDRTPQEAKTLNHTKL